jgi:hypothetical protein
LKAGIGEAFCRALANARREGAASWSNRAPAIRRAWSWLRSSPFFAVPRDKGGGWVLAERSAFVNECRRIVDTKGWYTRTNIFDDFSNAFAHMKIEYKLLCDSMSSHLAVPSAQLYSSVLVPHASPFAVFKMTVKAQKAAGKVTARPLHACTSLAWNGAASVLHQVLSPGLVAPWIVSSSRAAIGRVRENFSSGVGVFMHIDIVDFYLQGSQSMLVNAATFFAPEEHKVMVRQAAAWLLRHQFVDFGPLAEIYEVKSGTGMGSKSSGALANAGFRFAF